MKSRRLSNIIVSLLFFMFFSVLLSCKCDSEREQERNEINAVDNTNMGSGTKTNEGASSESNYSTGSTVNSSNTSNNKGSGVKVDTVPMGGSTSDEVRFSSSGNN